MAETMKRFPDKGFIWTNQKDVKLTIDVFKDAERKAHVSLGPNLITIFWKSNFDTTMQEILPVKLLEFINSEKLIMMLHTAGRALRMQMSATIRFISDKFPDIKIVLAAWGGTCRWRTLKSS